MKGKRRAGQPRLHPSAFILAFARHGLECSVTMTLANIADLSVAAWLWPWLFPSTYVLHIAEEFWGGEGYSAHMAKTKGVSLTAARFFFLTGLGALLMVAGIVIAERLHFLQLLLVILGTVVLVNGLSHTITGARTARYNPGLWTGILLWIPLGALTLLGLKGGMGGGRYFTGVTIGVAIQVAVSLLSLSGGKISEP
jgi:hypothetical protein